MVDERGSGVNIHINMNSVGIINILKAIITRKCVPKVKLSKVGDILTWL